MGPWRQMGHSNTQLKEDISEWITTELCRTGENASLNEHAHVAYIGYLILQTKLWLSLCIDMLAGRDFACPSACTCYLPASVCDCFCWMLSIRERMLRADLVKDKDTRRGRWLNAQTEYRVPHFLLSLLLALTFLPSLYSTELYICLQLLASIHWALPA